MIIGFSFSSLSKLELIPAQSWLLFAAMTPIGTRSIGSTDIVRIEVTSNPTIRAFTFRVSVRTVLKVQTGVSTDTTYPYAIFEFVVSTDYFTSPQNMQNENTMAGVFKIFYVQPVSSGTSVADVPDRTTISVFFQVGTATFQGQSLTHTIGEVSEPISLSNTYCLIGGYDFSKVVQLFRYNGTGTTATEDKNNPLGSMPENTFLNAFSVQSAESATYTVATPPDIKDNLDDIIKAMSYNDAVALNIQSNSRIDFSNYSLFVVPDSVTPDQRIYNQVTLQSGAAGNSDTSVLVHPHDLVDIVDATQPSPFQNVLHSQLIIDTVNAPAVSTQVRNDWVTGVNTNTMQVGGLPSYGMSPPMSMANLRCYDRVLSTTEINATAFLTSDFPTSAQPLYMFSAYDLSAVTMTWSNQFDTGIMYITTTTQPNAEPYITDKYPTSPDCVYTSGGLLNLLKPPATETSYQQSSIISVQVNIITSEVVTGTIHTSMGAASDSVIRQITDLQYIGDVTTTFINQKLGDAVMLGYIEGCPPIPGENLSLALSESTGPAIICQTILDKTEQTINMKADRNYSSDGGTFQLQGHVGVKSKWNAGIGYELGNEVSGILSASKEESHSTRKLLAETTKLDQYLEADRPSPTNVQVQNTDVDIVSFNSTLGHSQELNNPRDASLDRPGMPIRYLPRNNGTVFARVTVMNEFITFFRGKVIGRFQRPVTDSFGVPLPPIKLTIPFPLNPAYRIVGSLDGTIGLTASNLGKPFIPREIRQKFTVESYKEGSKASYMNVDQGSILTAKVLAHRTKLTRAEGVPVKYPSLKQSASVLIGGGQSRSGNSTSSRAFTTVEEDTYAIKSSRRGVSFAFAAHVGFVAGGITVAQEFSEMLEESTQKESTKEYTSEVSNVISGEYIDPARSMLLNYDKSTFSLENLYRGQHFSLDVSTELYIGLAHYDKAIVDYYRDEKKLTNLIAVLSAEGLLLCHIDATGQPAMLPRPGTVKSYQFDTYYISEDPTSADTFFDLVADPIWVQTDPVALQMSNNRNLPNSPLVDRVVHVVNYVDRNVAEVAATPVENQETTFVDVLVNGGDADSDMPSNCTTSSFQSLGDGVPTPNSLGQMLQLISEFNTLVGFVFANDVYIAAVVTTDNSSTPNNIALPTTAVNQLYLTERKTQFWNSAHSNVIDASYMAQGNPDGDFMITNGGVAVSIQTPESSFPLVVNGSIAFLNAQLPSIISNSDDVPVIAQILNYFYYLRQVEILTRFLNIQTVVATDTPVIIPPTGGIPVLPPAPPTFLDLQIRDNSGDFNLSVTVTSNPETALVEPFAWYGIALLSDEALTTQVKWQTFGYLDSNGDSIDERVVYNGAQLSNSNIAKFNVDLMELPSDFMLFYVYNINDVLLAKHVFHSRNQNDTVPTYDPLKILDTSTSIALNVGQNLSTTTNLSVTMTVTYQADLTPSTEQDKVILYYAGTTDVALWSYVSHVPGDNHTYQTPASPPLSGDVVIVEWQTIYGTNANGDDFGFSPQYLDGYHVDSTDTPYGPVAEIYSMLPSVV